MKTPDSLTPQKHIQEEPYTLCYKECASLDEVSVLREGVIQEAIKAKGMSRMRPFAFFLKNSKNSILGGIQGTTLYGCLYVNLLWIAPELRHNGWGSRLIRECEKLGLERQCTFASLTTMDWEALPFYQKLGYSIEFIREGYEKDSKMYVLRKELSLT